MHFLGRQIHMYSRHKHYMYDKDNLLYYRFLFKKWRTCRLYEINASVSVAKSLVLVRFMNYISDIAALR